MQCSPEEIEEKRQQALQKLQAKRNGSPNALPSPVKQFQPSHFKMGKNISNSSNKFNPYDKQRVMDKPKSASVEPAKKAVLPFYGVNKIVTATAVLVTSERFCVKMSTFSGPLVEVFKAVPSRSYDPKKNLWSFNIKEYEQIQRHLEKMKPDVVFQGLPKFVLKACHTEDASKTYDLSSIDSELLEALMPFQEEGVCFGIDKSGRCLIGDDMGLGKTFQALAIASYYRSDWPLLIATTASMRNVWEQTIYKYILSVPVMKVQYMTSSRDFIDESLVLIVSHDLMSRCSDKLLDKGFGVMIIDESHVLKNFKTKITKAATDLAKMAKRVILLSGTPALSRPSELFTQLSLIDARFFGSFMEFSKRYCDGKSTNFGWDASGQSNLQELEIVLAKRFMIRRTKENVLKALPNLTQELVSLDVNLMQFSEEDRDCLLALAVKYNSVKKDKHAALLSFFAETAKMKIPSVCSYILQVLKREEKFLVFAHHQIVLNAIEQMLVKSKQKYIRIDGSTSAEQRRYFVDKFQLDDTYRCAVLSITAANAGITLTAARLVLFAELHWNPSILSQAEARVHRIGQEQNVVIQYLVAPGTADDSIWPLLQNKQKTLKDIGLMGESFKDLEVKKQPGKEVDGCLTDNLNCSLTSANTLDIGSYFVKSPSKEKTNCDTTSLEEEMLNDDMDEYFSSVDINF